MTGDPKGDRRQYSSIVALPPGPERRPGCARCRTRLLALLCQFGRAALIRRRTMNERPQDIRKLAPHHRVETGHMTRLEPVGLIKVVGYPGLLHGELHGKIRRHLIIEAGRDEDSEVRMKRWCAIGRLARLPNCRGKNSRCQIS